ncbi:predicted protein [Aspergillus terreus NIH2624]|uniref:VWFA domain-containing protein n=1 Tax=Aspergillus terreus (strain NIH 2624 / FGSC A1156) TaxID=341663 RepID=Q0C7F9_ASPTN|nr:uncharacterized protein ATEG_10375 [Aspergillus terreus NIH2624]EAU29372.1 predicted protein [Aspergillus terreus NIH2624]
MEYRIKIENNAVDNRYYCIVARPPYVADVGPNQLMTPVLSNLDIVPIGNTETFRFKHEYFAFVGKLTRSGTRPAIERNNHLPVNFGTVHDNGPTIDVYFENNGMRIKQSEETGTFSRRGSFIIRCGKQPPASVRTEFVVGLAINLHKEGRSEVVPIAAMRYIADKPYEITHSGTMCICSDTEGLTAGDVVQSEVQRFVTIDFSSGARSVELVEDERENFTMVNAYDFLEKYNKTQLAGYYQAEKLKEIARNADAWGKTISEDRSLNDEFIDDLLVLALFDCILFLDNSLSMTWGERKKERREISAAIVKVETIFHNTKDVRVEFLNGHFRGVASEPEDMEKLLNGIRDFGKTPLGTELEAKVLNNYVYPKLKRGDAFRPVLISVITDGAPQGELKDTFKKKIKECKALLNHRDKTRVGDKREEFLPFTMRKLTLNIDVLFQISRVGDDHDAKAFIKELKNDPDLKGILHCTSYLDLDIDPEDDQNDPVNVYAPLERDSESQRFKFMDS